jgi:hypothetical protein
LIVTASLSQLVNFDYWQVEATERMLAVSRLPLGDPCVTTPGGNVSYDDQRRRYAQPKADRGVEQAAAHVRHRAILDGYVGPEHKEVAFALALILDEIARHLRALDEQLRARVLDCCRSILGDPASNV